MEEGAGAGPGHGHDHGRNVRAMMRRSESSPQVPQHRRDRSTSGSELEGMLAWDAQRREELSAAVRGRSSSMMVGDRGQKGHRLRVAKAPDEGGFFARLMRPTLRMRSPSFRVATPRRVDPARILQSSPNHSPLNAGLRFEAIQLPARIESAPSNTQYGTGVVDSGLMDSISLVPPKDTLSMQRMVEAVVYGIVNSILTIPCMMGYAAIIFRAAPYQPHMVELAKLVLFSSVVHQTCFSLKSSLSFSIGQVQDAGLIFLSTMATSIASKASPEQVLPTTLATLSIATALLGTAVFLVGKLRLAKLVSYLPMPVVGGYLAFIGFFCLEAGLGLTIGEDVSVVTDLQKLFSARAAKLAVPALVGGAVLALVSKKVGQWWALPLAILLLPSAFYGYMLVSGMTLAEAQAGGWMSMPREGKPIGPFWEVWYLFDFARINWSLLPGQIVTWISMVFVVSFSSCLDVVAIEMDMGCELDINHELCTVGLSNVLSGLTGGYTGSYIFSQTVFTYRTNTNSRLVGLVVILSELGLFMLPINLMEYVPLYFFAATLIFVGFDLMAEWLVQVYSKVSLLEYMVLMGTFLIITITNDLMLGIFAGIGLAILNFIVAYASVTHVETVTKTTSNVVRDYERRRILARLNRQQVVRLDLHGFLFFGTSMHVVKRLQRLLDEREEAAREAAAARGTPPSVNGRRHSAIEAAAASATAAAEEGARQPLLAVGTGAGAGADDSVGHLLSPRPSSTCEPVEPIRFIVLDFRRVTGMDATAIATGLMRVKQIALVNELTIVFTDLRPDIERLLVANHVIDRADPNDNCFVFQDLMDGLAWVENELLRSQGMGGRGSPRLQSAGQQGSDRLDTPAMPDIPYARNPDGSVNKVALSLKTVPDAELWLGRILIDFFGLPRAADLPHVDLGAYQALPEYFGLMRFRAGDHVFTVGDTAETLYITLVGEIALYRPARDQGDAEPAAGGPLPPPGSKLLQRAPFGCIFGDIHFTLEQQRQFAAVATEDSAVYFLSRTRFREMEQRNPEVAVGLYHCLTKFLSLTVCDLQDYDAA